MLMMQSMLMHAVSLVLARYTDACDNSMRVTATVRSHPTALCLLRRTHHRVNVSGVAVQQWASLVRDLLPLEFLDTHKAHMHGGPPVVFVDAAASGIGRPYYLGVMHYYDVSANPAST
jgi:hypothetical protein